MIKKAVIRGIEGIIRILYGINSYIYLIIKNDSNLNLFYNKNIFYNSKKGEYTVLYPPFKINTSFIGDYTYIAENSKISNSTIGKFCSIGPNLISGWGIHPLNGISTHPMFYSTLKQNGITLSSYDKIEEIKSIIIGNDVFIGMNVTILDGVKISDGAVIGAGAIVSKDIPPYAIAIGNPINVIGYRFNEDIIKKLLEIEWWEKDFEDLKDIEKNFFDIEEYLRNQN